MGGGSTTTNQNTSSQSINEIPEWVQNAGQANYGLAQQVASQPLQQYQGQMVANVSPQTQQAWNLAANSGNVGVGAQNAAQAGYLNTMSQAPTPITAAQAQLAPAFKAASTGPAQQAAQSQNVNAAQAQLSQLANTNLSPYMNPYTQSVINTTLPLYQQQLALQETGNAAQAVGSGAFGGSRFGVQQGVTGALGAQQMAQMAEQLNQANFAQAQQAGEFDVGQANQMGEFNANQMNTVNMANQQQRNLVDINNMQAGNQVGIANMQAANQVGMYNEGQANQMAQFNAGAQNTAAYQNMQGALAQEGLVNQAAQGLGVLGNQQMYNNLANYGMLTNAGGFEQQQAQNDINAQMAKFNQAFTYPQQQLGMMESSLGMTPYNTGTSGTGASTTTQTQNNPMASILGGAQALGSFASLIPGMPGSDRRLKTDIKKVGKHSSGVGIYSYRYKGDPKTYPKVVGPMAEDISKKFGSNSVREIPGSGGKMAVHPGVMNMLMTPPSSPGVQKAIGMMQPGTPGVLSAGATPPTRGLLPRNQKRVSGAPIVGVLGG